MYNIEGMFLYEILEDYRYCETDEGKDEIFNAFIEAIWSNNNKRVTYNKAIKYEVKPELLDTEVGKIFDTWSVIEYKSYKPNTTKVEWCSIIRQKLNNMYTLYCDPSVVLDKEYMKLLEFPKRQYNEWINGVEKNADELTAAIDNAMDEAVKLKEILGKRKFKTSWGMYKHLMTGFLRRCFENHKDISEVENVNYIDMMDCYTEDRFYVGYICNSLNGYFLAHQRRSEGIPTNPKMNVKIMWCEHCGKMMNRTHGSQKYCDKCKAEANRQKTRRRMKTIRKQRKMFD